MPEETDATTETAATPAKKERKPRAKREPKAAAASERKPRAKRAPPPAGDGFVRVDVTPDASVDSSFPARC